MRITALVALAISCALAGQYIAYVLRIRVRLLEKAEVMISMIRNEINYVALPANELMNFLSEKDELKELSFIKTCVLGVHNGEEFPSAWKKSLIEKNNILHMRRKDVEVITAFGENFGITDAEGQISNCDLCLERLKNNRKEAERERDQYSKLSVILGLLVGLGIIIVFL
jgi:stage III sporulation protein AB